MLLSWNEIRARATAFANEWADVASEDAEAKSFWDGFFEVFGMKRRRLARFEQAVARLNGGHGYIDLFWPGTLLVEHKSRGKDLDSAYTQGLSYFDGLKEDELPRYLIVSDFARIRLYDLEEPDPEKRIHTTTLADLPKHIEWFGFIAGFQKTSFKDQEPVNIAAAERLGRLHDYLEAQKFTGKDLEVFMTRVLFCLFAEDTGIFEKFQFEDYIRNHTAPDGHDLGPQLRLLFEVLNTPTDQRQTGLDDDLASFAYVNGGLFERDTRTPTFDTNGRETLLYCADFDWSRVSPAIFGSLFQSVMNKVERRTLGAHYTSEKNIMKVVTALFLDDLHAEFKAAKSKLADLRRFHTKLASLTFLDPACGSGNFLIITYRELRRLEVEVLRQEAKLAGTQESSFLSVLDRSKLRLANLYGIEIDEFSSKVAEVALWMVDHQMNVELGAAFGQYAPRLPLTDSPNIHHGNALRVDWAGIIQPERLSYILGNPPFVGSKMMDAQQRADVKPIIAEVKGGGVLDYVCMWFIIAAQYVQGTRIRVGFVATNSISQGEQVGILWHYLYSKGIKIHFAHRTFKWTNEARGKAAVYCVVVGFGAYDHTPKKLFDYETVKSDPQESNVVNINPYLIAGSDVVLQKRQKPFGGMPEMKFGNMPNDNGNLILDNREFEESIKLEPNIKKFIRSFVGANELINNEVRFVLWLDGIDLKDAKQSNIISSRIKGVKDHRKRSSRSTTVGLAETPYLFGEIRQPKEKYIIIPSVSSENRKYIPISILNPNFILSNACFSLEPASMFLFGLLTSTQHMAWVRYVCGRLENRYRYSKDVVYNNFPWPQSPTPAQKAKVEACAQGVLDARAQYPGSSLADLYDPLTMPKPLLQAHQALDRAVDQCYRKAPFTTERERIEFLFELYQQYTAPLLPTEQQQKRAARKKKA